MGPPKYIRITLSKLNQYGTSLLMPEMLTMIAKQKLQVNRRFKLIYLGSAEPYLKLLN